MPMTTAYLNLIADAADAITHIGLFNGASEISGGSPAYARKAVSWSAPSGGLVRPTTNLVFDVPNGATVNGWKGFSAASGGTDFGGGALTPAVFGGQGTYTLTAASTGIQHTAT